MKFMMHERRKDIPLIVNGASSIAQPGGLACLSSYGIKELEQGTLNNSTIIRNQRLASQNVDHGFSHVILEDVARVVGVMVDMCEIRKELDSFRRDNEVAGNRRMGRGLYLEISY
uniref:uncharacterized protein LOC122596787 n=1 Tax=Erigeron canadensis TaxID=72917 RepID=UPI001CB8C2CA|nr:uncharacterized protein LOC122596787 [Erigeron canadensis]